jgi:hypothetical protein
VEDIASSLNVFKWFDFSLMSDEEEQPIRGGVAVAGKTDKNSRGGNRWFPQRLVVILIAGFSFPE